MTVLALDFDGVVCDSSREVLATALATYEAIRPGSALIARLRARLGDAAWHALELTGDPIAAPFRSMMPLGNRAEDFGVALEAIERGAVPTDQGAYDAFFATLDRVWLTTFHETFYRQRAAARATDSDRWIGLHEPYRPFLDLLRRRSGDVRLALATAKDRRSARLLLDQLGVGDLFDTELVLDKETGVAKTAHLSEIRHRTGVAFDAITFVDDKVNHLERVAPLGVRPVLAAWGFNTAREHDLGFAVANIDNAERVLYGGGQTGE